ncbi:DUF6959 family protein [Corallococcus carmarthensis]|uniref:DUF6959 family protein n=1 Tax=Corallococcus carmarthensis TaxID=2316728 RepID=UPI00148D1664|nr:hypothetical protein [Corallococcus carmarthensis]NOK22647.1 hypothetical protein [Corallococcus carmarthensis]
MEEDRVEVLSRQSNAAVVRMPGRKFPGVVIQGDSLRILYELVKDARVMVPPSSATDAGEDDAGGLLEEAEGLLRNSLTVYESVLKAHGIPLPYVEAVGSSEK